MLDHSPVIRALRARSRLSAALAIALGSAAILAFGSAQSFGDHAPPACTSNNQQGTLCVSVSDTPDPVAYSSFDGNSTFLSYHVELSNTGGSNLSHVGLEDTIPTETGFFSASPSQGTCSHSGQTVTCALGSLSRGQEATVDIVVTAPATSDPNPPDITITNVAEGSFDENFNDQQNGGKQDTVTYSEPTTVSKTAGSTFVPAGETGIVGTDPGATQQGIATIDLSGVSTDVLASLNLLPPDTFCVNGVFKPPGSKKTYVCRNGAFVSASVLNADTGTHYTNTQRPLVFHLRWNASLVSSKQTVKNFVVFYQPDGSSQVQVITQRCDSGNPPANLPCLRNISKNKADGSWSVDLFRPDNGHMR
jgi:uncharacterized repeat protein (TIGR01451 family)